MDAPPMHTKCQVSPVITNATDDAGHSLSLALHSKGMTNEKR